MSSERRALLAFVLLTVGLMAVAYGLTSILIANYAMYRMVNFKV